MHPVFGFRGTAKRHDSFCYRTALLSLDQKSEQTYTHIPRPCLDITIYWGTGGVRRVHVQRNSTPDH
ncbi:hypothetical protein RSOLAG1IB_09879 [Rhizoctonia solani AG-1 IB]|uniref:Uncharacterized protein n=1 Tax=Thanatephorus cucumeris (strain AG1-IB / isolate 7/3/14) TaxID=1108050 RepID=A0A0B7FYK2_THACB|nr:hypothetical protein RSOLAG1IB_09879 [Rhizoctonia solani AG-1 IB]